MNFVAILGIATVVNPSKYDANIPLLHLSHLLLLYHRVVYNAESNTSYNAREKAKCIKWEDMKDAEFNKNMRQIRLYSKQGERIKMSCFLYGLNDFEGEFAIHHPYMVQRILDRSLF